MKKILTMASIVALTMGFSISAYSAECKVTAKNCGKAAKQFVKSAKKVKKACKKKANSFKNEAKCTQALSDWTSKYNSMKASCDAIASDCNPNTGGGGAPVDPGL